MDNRGQSIGISSFFLSIIGGAVVFFLIVVKIGAEIKEKLGGYDAGIAGKATGWIWTAGELMPVTFIVIAVVGVLSYAVWQRRFGI